MGQLLINNRCEYFSSKWIGGPFAVMLRLTPVANGIFIPYSFFEGMDESKRHDARRGKKSRGDVRETKTTTRERKDPSCGRLFLCGGGGG